MEKHPPALSGEVSSPTPCNQNPPLPAPYREFFECFNRGEFFEAHEVLELLWLQDRQGPTGDFFKGLIQIAGAFVHFQKGRPQPGQALLRRANFHLAKYPSPYLQWPTSEGLKLIQAWHNHLPNAARLPTPGESALE